MRRLLLLLCAWSPLFMAEALLADDSADPRHVISRQISQRFMTELKSSLTQSMTRSGPTGSIQVCKATAPAIAKQLSEEYGAKVGRTSLKVRNPGNTADDWQRETLMSFETRRQAGEMPRDIETFEVMPGGPARFMKAIGTQPLCISCHGENIAPAIKQAILHEYPQDQATGFRVGDIRGAFSIDWPSISSHEN